MTKRINILLKVTLAVSLMAGLCGLHGHIQKVEAANLKAGVLEISYDGAPNPLFSAENLAPGYTETKTVHIVNTGKVPHSFAIAVEGSLGSLAEALIIEPSVSGQVVWRKTVSQIAVHPESNVIIGSIAPATQADADIRAYLPAETGNDYQGKSTLSFSFVMGNESTDQVEPAAATVLSEGGRFVNENVTGEGQTAENIAGETQNVQGQVLGTSTEGEAKGEESESKQLCFWWWVLSIVLAVFLAVYGYLAKKREWLFSWVWPIFAALIAYLVHWILHDYYQPSKWCPYFVWFEVAILALYYVIVSLVPEKQDGGESGSN